MRFNIKKKKTNLTNSRIFLRASIFRPTIIQTTEDNFTRLFLTQSENASAKAALIITQNTITVFEKLWKIKSKWHRIPHYCFQVSQLGFSFPRNHFLFDVANNVSQYFTSAGIMDFLIEKCFPQKIKFIHLKTRIVLTWATLRFGFVIWFGCCGVAFVVFAAEMLYWNCWNICIKRKAVKKLRKIVHAKVHPEAFYNVQVKSEDLFSQVEVDKADNDEGDRILVTEHILGAS